MLPAWNDKDPLCLFQEESSELQPSMPLDVGDVSPSHRAQDQIQRNHFPTQQKMRSHVAAHSSNRNRDVPLLRRTSRPKQQFRPSCSPYRRMPNPQVSSPSLHRPTVEKARAPPRAVWDSTHIFHLRKSFDLLSATMLRRTPGEWISSGHATGLLPADISHEDLVDAISLFHSFSSLRFRHSDFSHKWYISSP